MLNAKAYVAALAAATTVSIAVNSASAAAFLKFDDTFGASGALTFDTVNQDVQGKVAFSTIQGLNTPGTTVRLSPALAVW